MPCSTPRVGAVAEAHVLEADRAAARPQLARRPARSGIWRGTAIERMPSCTTPTFSKIAVTFCATQPAMLAICRASGSAMATVPTAIRPGSTARARPPPVPTTSDALSMASVRAKRVIRRAGRGSLGVLVDRVAHERVLVAGAGEQLHRQDVGVAVDDPAGQRRAHLRHPARAVAQPRHEDAQHDDVAGEPQQHRDGEAPVGGAEQQHGAAAIDEDVPDGVGGRRPRFRAGPGRSA